MADSRVADLPAASALTGAEFVPIDQDNETRRTTTQDISNLASSPLTTKGDLLGHNGSTVVRIPVGNDDEVLIADSGESAGVRWGTVAAGGGVDINNAFNIYDDGGVTYWKNGSPSAYSALSSDPSRSFVKYHTHFDPIADEPAWYDTSHTLSPRGNGINTSSTKNLLNQFSLRSTGGTYLLTGNLAMGSGDFCIEFWFNPDTLATLGSGAGIADGRLATTNGAYPLIYGVNDGTLHYYVNSADRITSGAVITAGTFKHVSVDRRSGVTQLFYDGNKVGSDYSDSTTYLGGGFYFGNNAFLNAGIAAYYQEIRITIGASRYRGPTYTVPTEPFSHF